MMTQATHKSAFCRFRMLIRFWLLCALLPLCQPATAIDNLPRMGEPVDQSLSPLEERKIGEQFMRQAQASLPIVEDYQANEYIQQLGERLLANIPGIEYPYRFFLLLNDSINAFAVPGGYIGINSGLIRAFEKESQLAAVMAHEIAHVTQRHHARAYSAQSHNGLTAAATILAALIIGQNSAEAGQAALATGIAVSQQNQINYTRANEYEADRIGIDILAGAGFTPTGMVESFDILSKNSALNSSSFRLEYLRTHPLSDNRIAEAKNRAASLGKAGEKDSLRYQLFKVRLAVLASQDTDYLSQLLLNSKNASENIPAQYGLALLEERSGNTAKAEQRLSTLMHSAGDDFFLQMLDARIEYASGNQQLGTNKFLDLIDLYPTRYSPVKNLSDLLIEDDRLQHAYEVLSLYVRRTVRTEHNVYRQLANIQQKMGNETASHEYLAVYYEKSGQMNDAKRQLEMALNSADKGSPAELRISAKLKQLKPEKAAQ